MIMMIYTVMILKKSISSAQGLSDTAILYVEPKMTNR